MSTIIISGTPVNGFRITGPFAHPAIALEWAETWEEDVDWWIVPIINPKDREITTKE